VGDRQVHVLDGLVAIVEALGQAVENDLSHWRSVLSLGQPLTAPAVRPATMRRWKNRTKRMIGIVTRIAAAAMLPVGAVNWESPVKKASAAGTVRAALLEVS